MNQLCHGLDQLQRLMGPQSSDQQCYFHCRECGNFLVMQTAPGHTNPLEPPVDASASHRWRTVEPHEPILEELRQRAGSHIHLYKLKVLLEGDLSWMILDEGQRQLVQRTIETLARQT